MKKNEDGFSAPHILLVVLVIAIVGLAGWKVWDTNKKADPVKDATTATTTKTDDKQVSPTETKTEVKKDETADWKTYTSSLGGFTIKYPDSLYVEGLNKNFGEPDPVVASKFTGKEYWINFYSKGKNDVKDNFVIDLRIDPASAGNITADTHGKGKVIKTLSNGFEIWQVDSDSCLTTNLVTSKSNQGFVKLPNGNILKYLGTFCYGQGHTVSSSLEQQLNSKEYKTALDILGTIKFN